MFPPVYLNEKKLRSELQGKTILITGASFGIGEKLAYQLADLNIHLILVARTEEKLLTMKKEIEGKAAKVSVFQADLRNSEEIQELLTFIHKLPGGIDFLVSNAGISIRRSLNNSLDRYHDVTRTMAINYLAPVQLLLSVIPLLEKNQGHVINISTINVLLIPFPYWAAYQASKTAFDTWFRSAAPELNAMGISTTTIYLPLVKTRMILPTPAYQKLPAMSPDHVGRIICKAMYTKSRKYRPWWLIFGQFASIIFRGIWELSTPAILRKRRNDKNNG
ncbi:SDR family NAD(P)-dependent oxidoreductase [Desulfosporosinus youngiae]|uniref:SDR family NAD(P)-dependent oxidoreductase n=1 Tax=Desulfosporosinus youngiae TaxID=339862 RepID=UPI001FA7F259|nr:SDR family NAD(P)-dependent oxidoreductase [Desulfosporosinus youngiae]